MRRNPVVSILAATERIGLSAPTVAKALGHMMRLGILEEITGRERRRIFVYRRYLDIIYLDILNEGMELLNMS